MMNVQHPTQLLKEMRVLILNVTYFRLVAGLDVEKGRDKTTMSVSQPVLHSLREAWKQD